jgi:hypothetical protein
MQGAKNPGERAFSQEILDYIVSNGEPYPVQPLTDHQPPPGFECAETS